MLIYKLFEFEFNIWKHHWKNYFKIFKLFNVQKYFNTLLLNKNSEQNEVHFVWPLSNGYG